MSIISSDDIHLLHRVHIPAPLNSANYFRSNNLLLDAFNEKNKKREKKKKRKKKKKGAERKEQFSFKWFVLWCFQRKTKGKEKEDHLVNTKPKSVRDSIQLYKWRDFNKHPRRLSICNLCKSWRQRIRRCFCLANEARIGPGSARPFILKSHHETATERSRGAPYGRKRRERQMRFEYPWVSLLLHPSPSLFLASSIARIRAHACYHLPSPYM